MIAKRYAKSLLRIVGYDLANKEKFKELFAEINHLFSLEEARKLLSSPVVSHSTKKSVLDLAFEKVKLDSLIKHFFYTVLDAKRASLIPDIITIFNELIDEKNNCADAKVVSASRLDAQQLSEIKGHAERVLAKKLSCTLSVDPELLGGFVIYVGHTVIDLSLKHKLEMITNKVAQ